MRHYETMFILKPTLTAEETISKIESIKSIIVGDGGEICAIEDMGIKVLAYEIAKQKRGYYYVIYFKTDASNIAELERNYRINEDIIRHIVIKYDSKREMSAWQSMVEKANKKNAPKGQTESEAPKSEAPKSEDLSSEQSEVSEQSKS